MLRRRDLLAGAAALATSEAHAQTARRLMILSGNNRDFPYPAFPNTPIFKLETVSDLQSASGSNTITNTAIPDSPYGGSAVQFSSVGFASLFVGKLAPAPVNVSTGGNIKFNFEAITGWQVGGTQPSVFNMRLYSAGTPASPSANYHQGGQGTWFRGMSTSPGSSTPGRWQTLSVPVNAFGAVGSGADLTSIKYAAYSITSSTGTVYCLGSIVFEPNPRTKAALMFRFDDATPSALTAQAILDPVGAAGFIAPGAVASPQGINGSGRLTTANVLSLLRSGWQFCSQCYSTEDSLIVNAWTSAQRQAEYVSTRNYTRSPYNRYRDSYDGTYYSNVSPADNIAWPELNGAFRTLQRFDNGNPTNPPLAYGETFPFGDPKNIVVLNQAQNGGGGGVNTTLYTGYAMDQVIASKGVLTLAHHNDLTNSNILDAFNYAVTRATGVDAANIEIITPRKLLAPYNGDTLQG